MAFQFPANPVLNDLFTPASGVTYKWNGTGWALLGTGVYLLPSGIVFPFAGSLASAPDGFLPCDGESYLAADYPALFAMINYLYGGSGLNFNVPDLRGRVVAGFDNMATSMGAAGRITASWADNWNGSGGEETHLLTTAEMPAHSHTITDPGHLHSVSDSGHTHAQEADTMLNNAAGLLTGGAAFSYGYGGTTQAATTGISLFSAGTSITVDNAGGGTAHANVQPTIVMNYIIKT